MERRSLDRAEDSRSWPAEVFERLAAEVVGFRARWRAWLIAIVTAMAVCAPTMFLIVAPVLSAVAFFTNNPKRFRFEFPSLSAIALALFAALSMLWTVNFPLAFRAAATYAILGVSFIAARYVLRGFRDLQLVAFGYLTGCVVLIARVVILALTRGAAQAKFRLNLPDVNANYAGYALALGFAVAVFLWIELAKSKLNTALFFAMSALLAIGILVTDTRASFLSLAVLAIWLGASRLLKKPPLKYLLAAVVAFALAIATGALDKVSLLAEGALGRPTGDWSGRLELWPLAREWWLRHFLIGSGASTFQASNIYGVGAHSLILEIGTGLGLVGVVLYASFLWSSLRSGGSPRGSLLVGSFVAVSAFSYLTGQWEGSPAAWMALALFSRAQSLEMARPDLFVETPAAGLNTPDEREASCS